MSHTILLVQASSKPESRTYSDYETVNDCLEGKFVFDLYLLNFFYQIIADGFSNRLLCTMNIFNPPSFLPFMGVDKWPCTVTFVTTNDEERIERAERVPVTFKFT